MPLGSWNHAYNPPTIRIATMRITAFLKLETASKTFIENDDLRGFCRCGFFFYCYVHVVGQSVTSRGNDELPFLDVRKDFDLASVPPTNLNLSGFDGRIWTYYKYSILIV